MNELIRQQSNWANDRLEASQNFWDPSADEAARKRIEERQDQAEPSREDEEEARRRIEEQRRREGEQERERETT